MHIGSCVLAAAGVATLVLQPHAGLDGIGVMAGLLGVIGALVAYVLWFRGLSKLPALAASFLSFASPLCATVLGYLFLDQTLRPLQFLGAAAVVGAVVLAQPRDGARTPDAAPPARTASRV